MRNFIFYLAFIVPLLGSAQNSNIKQTGEITVFTGLIPGIDTFDFSDKKVEGTPFLFDDWQDGSVTLKNSMLYINQKIKYDIYMDRILIMNPQKNVPQLITKDRVKAFAIVTDTVDTVYFENFVHSYYQILCVGKATLMAKHSKHLLEADEIKGDFNTRKNDEFSHGIKKFFIMTSDKEIHKVKTNMKSISTIFPGVSESLKEYSKENLLNLKNESDLVSLIKYYNSNLEHD
jgi:hypothetical protein